MRKMRYFTIKANMKVSCPNLTTMKKHNTEYQEVLRTALRESMVSTHYQGYTEENITFQDDERKTWMKTEDL